MTNELFNARPEQLDGNAASAGNLHAENSLLHEGWLFGQGVVSGSVGVAIDSAKRLYDGLTGTEYKPTELFSNQAEVNNSTAGKIGSAIGTAVDLLGLAGATFRVTGLSKVGAAEIGAPEAITGEKAVIADSPVMAENAVIDDHPFHINEKGEKFYLHGSENELPRLVSERTHRILMGELNKKLT